MIYCPNCRKQLNDGSNFCSNCGYKIPKSMLGTFNSNDVNVYYNPPIATNVVNLPKEKSVTVADTSKLLKSNSVIKNILKSNKDYHHRNKDAISEIESILEQSERIIFALNGSLFIKRLSG